MVRKFRRHRVWGGRRGAERGGPGREVGRILEVGDVRRRCSKGGDFGRQRLGLGFRFPVNGFAGDEVLLRLLGLEAAGRLDSFQFALCAGKGALHAALCLPDAVEQRDLDFGACNFPIDVSFAHFHTSEFPLADGHLFEVEEFRAGTGLPFLFEKVTEAIEFLAVLAGKDDGAGAEAVTEGVQPDSCLALGSAGAG